MGNVVGGCSESNSLESEKTRTRMWKLSIKRVSETRQLASTKGNIQTGHGYFWFYEGMFEKP